MRRISNRGGGEAHEGGRDYRGDDPRWDALQVTRRRVGNDDLVAYR
jgi:hypothetical protein